MAENHNKALLSVANGKDISPSFLWFNKRLAYKITGRGVPRLIIGAEGRIETRWVNILCQL